MKNIKRYIILRWVRLSILPTTKFVKNILVYSQDMSLNIELLKIVIDGVMDTIKRYVDTEYIRLRTTNVTAATEAENVGNKILDIIERRTGKLSLDEFCKIYIILQHDNKKGVLL